MIYPPNISYFVDYNNRQILTNVSSVLFNTLVKELKNVGHICTFRTVILDLLLQHTESIKIIAGETNIIKFAFI